MVSSLRELEQGEDEWRRFNRQVERQQLSRRRVLRSASAAALLALGGMSALIGCSSDEEAPAGTPAIGGGGGSATPAASATSAPTVEGVTGSWDETGTAPYKQGLQDPAANAPVEWQKYPWVYKYGPWRYNWDIPVTRGGHVITPNGPAANYDVMVNGIGSQPVYNKMYNAGLREGLDPLTASIEPDLVVGEEHTPDYTSWTFKIPANAAFHNVAPVNGRLLTAADVVFSFERHMDTNVNRTPLRNVTKVTAVDDTTVRFDLSRPALTFPNVLASPHYPVFAPEAFENQDEFKQKPIGTGPFVLAFSEYQNRSDFVRFPEYWQTPPYKPEKYGNTPLPLVDKFTRQYFANTVASKAAFFAGEVDQLAPGGGLDVVLTREELERVPNAIVETNLYWSCCPLGIALQYKNPLFQDIRVRQALSMSINRPQVWSDGMDKTGVVGASPVPFDFSGYKDGLPPDLDAYGPNAQYNPQRAKELLAEAGVSTPLKFQIYATVQGNPAWQGALDTVVFNWQQAGIAEAEIVVRDPLVYGQDLRENSFPDMVFSIGLLPFGYTIDSLVAPAFLTDSPSNRGSVSDPQLDDLLNKWAVATDPATGVDLARQMSTRIVDNVDHLWFGWIGGIEVDQPWFHGEVMSVHNQPNGIGLGNYKYVWIDETAPGGRGGKPV